jgi:hypothetical protein
MRALLVALVIAGCGGAGPAGQLRYRNAAPVWRVNDRLPVAKSPAPHTTVLRLYYTDSYLVRPVTRALDVREARRALDVNSLDEVPDSTWFTNRIGTHDLTDAELRAGANRDPSPDQHRPWTITGAKVGGMSVGFVFEDTRKRKFLLKFDAKAFPEAETGAHIICHRILSAIGYNVPQDYLATIRREDLMIAPDATKKDPRGHETPLTAADLDRALKTVVVGADGGIRVLMSEYIAGKPLGGYPIEGVRDGDPNDVIPHERRRSIRGQYSIFAWLNHTDIKEHNTLDAYVADPADPGHHYVLHYLIDFGKALGVYGRAGERQTPGHTYAIDADYAAKSLIGLGLWQRPWEAVDAPVLPGLGLYDVASYDPGEWRPNTHYWPLEDTDRVDGFWGAKQLIRFTRDQLAAIVDEARFSDPRTTKYLVDTLVARQRKTARYWFDRVAPLDRFEVAAAAGGARVCFDDLMLTYQLAPVAAGTRYRVDVFDYDGRPTAPPPAAFGPDPSGRTCVDNVTPGTSHDGYTIVRFAVTRSALKLPAVRVHLARDPAGALRVIGIRRD